MNLTRFCEREILFEKMTQKIPKKGMKIIYMAKYIHFTKWARGLGVMMSP